MNRLMQKVQAYLTDADIDINERLGVSFINIGIIAAFLGVIICLLAHEPVSGTIATALIAVSAPLIAGITRHTHHSEFYGRLIGVLIIIMIPIVWLTTGAESGGTGFWFLYEMFYIMLFADKKRLLPYILAAVLMIAAALTADILHPELFFHFTNTSYALVSKIGSGIVVTAEILITVYIQKSLYIYEREINTRTEDTTRNFVASIATIIDTKDLYTGGHSRRVAECARALALRLGLSQEEADNIFSVALLHDIGKIGVPDRVLNKPGRLTEDEFAQIRRHPVYGASILKNVTTIPHLCDGVLYHHERYDGTGYPEGLKGEAIPFIARIISVADSYDAMSSNRIYRQFLSRDEIIRDIARCRGTQFDPHIADVFIEMLKEGFTLDDVPSGKSDSDDLAPADDMLRHITVTEPPHKTGATVVSNAEFTGLYDYLCNLNRRYGEEMVLLSIGLDTDGASLNYETLMACMAGLNHVITRNIRASDICTCGSTTSFLVLLMNTPRDNVDQIIDRVSRDYYRLQGSMDITLCHSIIEIDARIHQDPESPAPPHERRSIP